MKYIKEDQIYKFINKSLLKINCDKFTSTSIASSLTNTSLRGIDSYESDYLSIISTPFKRKKK